MTRRLHLTTYLSALLLLTAAPAARAAYTPLTGSDVILSVDINGGNLAAEQATTLGWDAPSTTVLPVAPGPVLWTPWGGPGAAFGGGNTGGDNTQLPHNTPNVGANSITKSFGPASVTISIPGTATNYGQVAGAASMNSRDRSASAIIADQAGIGNENQFGRNMYRDFIFAGTSGSNVASTNFLQVAFTGLDPLKPHKIALYNYDRTGGHRMHWTATPPTTELNNIGWFEPGTNTFLAPADVIETSWVGGAAINALPGPSVFNLWSNASGEITVWGWGKGGDPLNPDQNNFSDTSYLNGFQIAIPEPSAIALGAFGAAGIGLVRRRRA